MDSSELAVGKAEQQERRTPRQHRHTGNRAECRNLLDPVPDQRGDVAYKTAMCGEMTRRALAAAHGRASKS
jgi:carbon-monoxide dehydrogenase medium subunit